MLERNAYTELQIPSSGFYGVTSCEMTIWGFEKKKKKPLNGLGCICWLKNPIFSSRVKILSACIAHIGTSLSTQTLTPPGHVQMLSILRSLYYKESCTRILFLLYCYRLFTTCVYIHVFFPWTQVVSLHQEFPPGRERVRVWQRPGRMPSPWPCAMGSYILNFREDGLAISSQREDDREINVYRWSSSRLPATP